MASEKQLTSELISRNNLYSFQKYIGILPNPDKILSRTGKTIETYRELKNDPHVWSCIQSRKSGLLSLDYRITSSDSAKGITNEIRNFFQDIDTHKLFSDILEAPLFGYQPIEIIWEKSGRTLYPKNIEAKPQEWFAFNNDGQFTVNNISPGKKFVVPEYKFLLPRYENSYQNPYGESLLGKCYWPVTFKNGGMRFWVNFMEKYGMPLLLGKYGRGASSGEAEILAETLNDMAQDAVIVAPADIDIEIKEPAKSSSVELYMELIKQCNNEISKALLSQTLTTQLDMGSYAAAETHFKVRGEVIKSDIRLVEKTVNLLIKYIVELNFGSLPLPKLRLLYHDNENETKINRDMQLIEKAGIKFTRKYWMSEYGFKDDEIITE